MIDLRFYTKVLMRRLPIMVMLVLASSAVGYIVAQRLPTLYETSATLLVESAQISDDLAQSTVQVSAAEQLGVIQRQLMTRANLIDIANRARVFPDMARMTPDEIVQRMRASTQIRQQGGRNQATVMTISFKGPLPDRVANVVNEYVTIVLAANSDFRTSMAEGTLAFFEQEVEGLSNELDVQSQKIVEFKNANAEALPESLEFRLNRQNLLQERLARTERDLEALAIQEESIRRIYESTGAVGGTSAAELTPLQQRLQSLEAEKREALTVYSEQNPRVAALERQIETVRAEMARNPNGTSSDPEAEGQQEASPLEVSLSEISARREVLEQEAAQINRELETLEESLRRTPAIGIALEAMERDLSNIRSLYSAAVQRMSQAEVGERIELSSKGERITVLEPPSVPDAPASPNRQLVALSGVGLGLGLAGGWFVLLELLNQVVRRPAEITARLNITPLAIIPRIETSGRRRLRQIAKLTAIILGSAFVLAAIWAFDTYYKPLDQLFEQFFGFLL